MRYCHILEKFRETETVSWILHSRLSTGTHGMFTCLPDIPSSGSKSTVMKSQCITAATWSLVPETVFLLLTELYRPPAHHGKGPSEKPKDIRAYGSMECHCIHFLMTISAAFLSNCLIETAVMYEEWKENISYRGYSHLLTASQFVAKLFTQLLLNRYVFNKHNVNQWVNGDKFQTGRCEMQTLLMWFKNEFSLKFLY